MLCPPEPVEGQINALRYFGKLSTQGDILFYFELRASFGLRNAV